LRKYIVRTYPIVIVICLLLLSILNGCAFGDKEKEHSKNVFALNTWINIRIYAGREGPKILDRAVQRIDEIERRMSITIEDSDVSRINSNAGIQPVKVHDDTFKVIEKALEYSRLSEGTFDITIYPIVQLWGITSEHPRVPSDEEIRERLRLVDYRKVVLNKEEGTVYLQEKGMGIDLGAIAKGYAADEVVRVLKQAGVKRALINMGGNVIVLGKKPNDQPWRIGIQDPRSDGVRRHIAVVEAVNESVVSSGDYERYIEDVYKKTGVRYHHIFDTSTGYPADSGLMATTVVAENSIDADALSTIVFVMGADKGLDIVEQLGNSEAMAVTVDKKIYTSRGFDKRLTVTDEEYEIMP